MKLTRLLIKNFRGARYIEVVPVKPLTKIAAQNAEGKTSALDGLTALLGGARAHGKQPVTVGEEQSDLLAEFDGGCKAGGITVKKVIEAAGKYRLEVFDKSGAVELAGVGATKTTIEARRTVMTWNAQTATEAEILDLVNALLLLYGKFDPPELAGTFSSVLSETENAIIQKAIDGGAIAVKRCRKAAAELEAVKAACVAQDALVQAFGDAVADMFEQMLKGKWVDDHGHDVGLNTAMIACKRPMLAAIEYRKAAKGETK